MSSVFLFGAGASYGSGPCAPHQPPLGGQLFAELQARGGAAARVDPDLAAAFLEDFEVGMDRFLAERNTQTAELLRDMARYLAPISPLAGNHYIDLVRILIAARKKFVVVTTNYDMLIEHAIMREGYKITYGNLPVPAGEVSLLKIHGSCNFLPDFGTNTIRVGSFDLSHSPKAVAVDAPVKFAQSAEEVLNFCNGDSGMAPALALYAPSKRVLFCPAFIEAQRQGWLSALRSAARIYVIGLRVHPVDDHIWGALARSKAPLYYAAPDHGAFTKWAREKGRRKTFVLADSFKAAIPLIAAHLRT